MMRFFKLLHFVWRLQRLKSLDRSLQKMTAERIKVKEKARKIQADYEKLENELKLQQGSVALK